MTQATAVAERLTSPGLFVQSVLLGQRLQVAIVVGRVQTEQAPPIFIGRRPSAVGQHFLHLECEVDCLRSGPSGRCLRYKIARDGRCEPGLIAKAGGYVDLVFDPDGVPVEGAAMGVSRPLAVWDLAVDTADDQRLYGLSGNRLVLCSI